MDVLIRTLELQILRVGIADLDTQENAGVRRSVLRGEFHGDAFMVGFGSVRDVRILMVSRNEPLLPPGGPLRNYILQLRRMLDTVWVAADVPKIRDDMIDKQIRERR